MAAPPAGRSPFATQARPAGGLESRPDAPTTVTTTPTHGRCDEAPASELGGRATCGGKPMSARCPAPLGPPPISDLGHGNEMSMIKPSGTATCWGGDTPPRCPNLMGQTFSFAFPTSTNHNVSHRPGYQRRADSAGTRGAASSTSSIATQAGAVALDLPQLVVNPKPGVTPRSGIGGPNQKEDSSARVTYPEGIGQRDRDPETQVPREKKDHTAKHSVTD